MSLQLKSLLNRAIDNLDVTLAALGGILAIPLTIYFHTVMRTPVYTLVGVIVFLVCLAYLLLRRRSPAFALAQVKATPRVYLLLNILFFCLLTYSIAAFYLRPELYTRPLGYFVALAAMSATLAIEILFLPPRKSAAYFALFKIVLIGLSLVWSQLLIYPSIVGVDPWYHQMFTLKILDAGHIPSGYLYSNLPGMHLVIGGTSLITGLDYKMAAMLSVSLLQVICTALFIFLLGKFIHSVKAGLLAALFLVTANSFIWFGYWTIPNSMAVVFIPIIVYLLFKLRQERPKVSICLSALFIAVLILTHTLAAVMLTVLLFSIWLGFELYKRLRYQAAERARIFLIAALVLTGAGLSYWAQDPFIWRQLSSLARSAIAMLLPHVTPPSVEPSVLQVAVAQYQNSVPFTERIFNQLGFFLFCAFALIGAFALFSRSLRNRYGFALVIAGLIALVIAFVGVATGFFALARWTYLSQVLLAIPVGIAFLWLGSLPRKSTASACLIGIMVFALSFLTVMSPEANIDNRTFSPNTIVRFAFTQPELEAMNTVSHVYDGKTGTDWYIWELSAKIQTDWYIDYLRPVPVLHANVEDIGEQIYLRDFSHLDDTLILLRDEIIQQPFKIGSEGVYRLTYDPRQSLAEQGFSKIYDCGSVCGFIK